MHVVNKGDTLHSVARRNHVPVGELARADRPSRAAGDVSLEKSVGIISRRKHDSRDDLKRFVHDIPLKSIAGA